MTAVPFESMPADARLWIFAASEPLSEDEASTLLARTDEFLSGWHAHGAPVVGARDLRYDRFLLVAADERATGVSGCSIDSLYRVLKTLEKELDVALLDASPVWFRDATGEIRSATRADFRKLVEGGEIDGELTVFDNTAATVGALREGMWERPMSESWHGKAFRTAHRS